MLGENEKSAVESLDRFTGALKSIETAISNLSARVEVLSDRYGRLEGRVGEQDRLVNRLYESTSIAASTVFSETARLSAEIERFSNERKRLSEEVFRGALEGLSRELEARVSRFEKLGADFSRAADAIESVGRDALKTKAELERFVQISEKIRSTDFDVKELVKKVEELSRQNNALQNRADRLQKLVSQERRRE